jgi:hypothetical protein
MTLLSQVNVTCTTSSSGRFRSGVNQNQGEDSKPADDIHTITYK